jgi:hypothetical protein
MSDFNKRWSVASVFNVYGMNRHSTAEMLANAHRLPRALRDIDDQSTKAASVADCIRSLGYTVVCSWTEESGRYVILSIQNDMEFCYGSRGSVIYEHCPEEHQRCYRYLAGHRTIYEKVDSELSSGPTRRLRDLPLHRLENVGGETSWEQMKKLIDDGCIHNMFKGLWGYSEGVSTIGNTLPRDIVEALQSFRSDDADFHKEPDYEFYIPDSMKELPEACPAQESSSHQDGGSAAAPGAAATATATAVAVTCVTPVQKKTSSKEISSSSDSSDSEDD